MMNAGIVRIIVRSNGCSCRIAFAAFRLRLFGHIRSNPSWADLTTLCQWHGCPCTSSIPRRWKG